MQSGPKLGCWRCADTAPGWRSVKTRRARRVTRCPCWYAYHDIKPKESTRPGRDGRTAALNPSDK